MMIIACPDNGEAEPVGGGGGGGGVGDGGYLADGHALTAEERAFLQSNLPSGKNAALDDDILYVLHTNDSVH